MTHHDDDEKNAEEFRFGINPRGQELHELDFDATFGNDHPVALEIGSGKGRWLLDSARSRPDVNFVGIEKSLHYYRVIARRIEKSGLQNARIINFDAYRVLEAMLAPESIAEIHIYFPDPWPRKREKKRRIIRDEACMQFGRVLAPHGSAIYVTDHREYWEEAVPVLAKFFEIEAGEVDPSTPPRTNYEAKYRVEGRPIFEVRFKKK